MEVNGNEWAAHGGQTVDHPDNVPRLYNIPPLIHGVGFILADITPSRYNVDGVLKGYFKLVSHYLVVS